MRKIQFANNEYYHLFNRGVDKRKIFLDREDLSRFFQSMEEFNTLDPIGSIFENSRRKNQFGVPVSKVSKEQKKLVNFICYALNPNHYHFILKQVAEDGIMKFMHRLGLGYALFFNNKYGRSGTLFEGRYKAVNIDSNEYLLHVSAYVNLNNKIHKIGDRDSKTSWEEYADRKKGGFCEKDIILEQFNNQVSYKEFAESALEYILERRDMERFLLE